MKIRVGQIVKVADIGHAGKVVAVSGELASIEFHFPEETVVVDGCQLAIIEDVLSESEAAA